MTVFYINRSKIPNRYKISKKISILSIIVIFYATLRYFEPLNATLRYFTLLYATLLYLGRPVNSIHVVNNVMAMEVASPRSLRSGLPNGRYVTLRATSPCRRRRHK